MELSRGCLAVRATSLSLGCLYHYDNLVCLRNNFCQFECNGISEEKFHLLFYSNFTLTSPKARQSQFLGTTTIAALFLEDQDKWFIHYMRNEWRKKYGCVPLV